jgi:PAS domain S-box-containing protein
MKALLYQTRRLRATRKALLPLAGSVAAGSLLTAATYTVVRVEVVAGGNGATMVLLAALWGLVAVALAALLFLSRERAMLLRLYRAEQDRAAAARQFEDAFAGAGDIFVLSGPAQRIVEANDAAVAAYGYSRGELLTMTIRELRTPELRAEIERDWAGAARAGGVQFETVHQRRDGSQFPVEVRTNSLEIGGALYHQNVIRDISERKRAEAALAEQMVELHRWHQVSLDREERVLALKGEVNELLGELGRPPRYGIAAPGADEPGAR